MPPASPWKVTADGGRWSGIDAKELLGSVPVLFAPDGSYELRSLPSGRSRLVTADRPEELASAASDLSDGRGLYYTLNPVRADLTGSARNADVLSRRWLFVDVDPVKAEADSSSTEAEKSEAWRVASAVIDDALARGWGEPVAIDSGNGYHLLYRVELPNDQAASKLVSAVLKSMAKALDSDGARIDTKVFNAARIAKLPGTWARKGINSADCPHRLCRLVYSPDALVPVSAALLADMAGGKPTAADSPFKVTATNAGPSAYVRSAVLQETARVAMAPDGDRNNTLNDAAFRLGTLLGTGEIDRTSVEEHLLFAAGRAGLAEEESRKTVKSGLDAGVANPRAIPARPTYAGPGWFAAATEDGLPPDDDVTTVRLSDVQAVPVEWLMPNRIPLGKITLLAGFAKQGKSFMTMDLAARVSSGDLIPCGGGECFVRGSVVLLSAEDDLDDTVKPRLVAAGADTDKIFALTTVRQADGSLGPFDLSYIPHLERAISRAGDTRLVIIDPITHYVGGKIDDHKVAQLRSVLGPLKDLASRAKVAMLIVSHLNKGSGTNALHRVIGSSAYTALARANWLVARDPKDPKRRLFLDAGTNLAEDPKGLAYRINGGRIEWEDTAVDMNANEALEADAETKKKEARPAAPANKGQEAFEWLAEILAHGDVPSEEIFDKGNACGFRKNMLYEAKEKLGIKARREGFGGAGRWFWGLPRPVESVAPSPAADGETDPPF